MKVFRTCLGMLAVLGAPLAQASNQEIRALFQPDPAQPSKNVFVNKTPNSGYCAVWPAECVSNNMFSIRLYTGPISYTLGPGADFDLGPLMQPDDGSLTLDFVLDVQHTLKVEIPPGGNKVLLEPQGGWQGWLEHGRKPARLHRDQIFNISASSRFTMKLECEYDQDSGCAIVDSESGYGGIVSVSVSLPNGLTDSSGQPVRRMPLSRAVTGPFQPGIYVDRKPGTLHFEMGERDTSWLISNAKGRPYKGNITVVWDSEL
jgi:hypothetical protein